MQGSAVTAIQSDGFNFRFAMSGDAKIAYNLQGQGPKVLFIQGVGVHGNGWLPQVSELSHSYSCLTFDNRGIGHSTPVSSSIQVETMVDDTLAVLADAGWEHAHVVGHSLGGLIAQAFAIRYPEKVRSLSLLCTFCDGAAVAPITPKMIWWGLRSSVGTKPMRRRGFLGLLYPPGAAELADSEQVAMRLAPVFGHDLAIQPPIVAHQLRAMRKCNVSDELHRVEANTLVVSGAHDLIAPPALGNTIASRIPNSRFVEIVDAAHGLPITHAPQANRILSDHLQQCESQTGK